MADQSLEAKFGLDDSAFQAGMKNIAAGIESLGSKMDSFGSQASSGFGKAEQGSNSFMSSLQELVPVLSAALVVDKLVDFGKSCVDAATKADTAFRKLQFSTEKIGGASPAVFQALIEWTDKYADSLNMLYSHDELQSAEAQLSTFGLTTEQIKSLLPQIVDLAQATGTTLEEATNKATQAIMGHGRALISAGIHITDTGSKTDNLAQLQQKLAKFTGEAASQLDSFANRAKEADDQVEVMERNIGEKLTPVWNDLKTAIIGVAQQYVDFLSGTNEQDRITDKILSESSVDQLRQNAQNVLSIMMKMSSSKNYDQSAHAKEEAYYNKIIALIKEKQAQEDAVKASPAEKNFKAQGTDATKEKEAKDPAEKIKDLLTIMNEAEQATQVFGKTTEDVYKSEATEIESAMKALLDKKKMTADEKAQYDELATALKTVKAAQADLDDKKDVKKYNNEEFIAQYNERVRLDIEAYDKQVEAAKKAEEEKVEAAKRTNDLLKGMAAQTAEITGNAIGNALSGKKIKLGADMFKMLGDLVKRMGESVLATGTLMGTTPLTAPLGIAQMAEGGGLIALGSAMSAIKMASGGVVSGSTFANIGEYAGASHNPEVVAPLDKLKGMMGNNGGGGRFSFEIMGDKLLGIQDRVQNNSQFVMGTNNQ